MSSRCRAASGPSSAGQTVLDTTRALYVWEWPHYPQYYVPIADVDPDLLVDEQHAQHLHRGTAHRHSLRADGTAGPAQPGSTATTPSTAWPARSASSGTPSMPGSRRTSRSSSTLATPTSASTRCARPDTVRVELDGDGAGRSASPVMVFETGLPTRYYLNRTEVNFDHLRATDTVTSCPYKGRRPATGRVRIGDTTHPDSPGPTTSPPDSCSPSPA